MKIPKLPDEVVKKFLTSVERRVYLLLMEQVKKEESATSFCGNQKLVNPYASKK